MVEQTNVKPWTPTEEKIQAMVERIVREFDPLQIILFGSLARGDAHADSDVDLLVVMPHAESKRDIAVAIGVSVADILASKDIVVTTPDEIRRRGHVINTVLRWALRDGRLVYERE